MLPPPLQARKDIWKEVHEVHMLQFVQNSQAKC